MISAPPPSLPSMSPTGGDDPNPFSELSVTILLVEDDPAILNGVADLLQLEKENWPYQLSLLLASDGVAALELLKRNIPDLIISDISMPRMDGFELLDNIRQMPQMVHTPVIFLSARGAEEDVYRGQVSGAELYLRKPFEAPTFVSLMRSQLDLSLLRKQRRNEVAQQLRQALLNLFQHEFRTPTSFIIGYAELLKDTIQTDLSQTIEPDDVRVFVEGILTGCERLSLLIDKLKLVSKLESDQYWNEIRPKVGRIDDLAELVQAAVDKFADAASKQDIKLSAQIQSPLPPVWGDSQSISIMLEQLLDNAVKFTAARSTHRSISVRAEADDDTVKFVVRDTGIGFPNWVTDSLFKLFMQHDRLTLEQQGIGVGLTIVQHLVELHGGKIEALGQPQQGSMFSIRLPQYDPAQAPPRDKEEKKLPSATILIVEDNEVLLEGLHELLSMHVGSYRFNILTALDGREALLKLENYKVDLVLSDIMMPRMDGIELLQRTRQNPNWVKIPFVFLTAYSNQKARLLSPDEYIQKPYDNRELLSLIEARLRRYFAQEDAVEADLGLLKRRILGSLPTDFESRLKSVSSQSASLVDGEETSPEAFLESITAQGGAIKRLVADYTRLVEMLTVTLTPTFEIQAQPITNLATLFEHTLHRLRDSAESNNRTLELVPAEPLPAVFGDSNALVELMNTLVTHQLERAESAAQPVSAALVSVPERDEIVFTTTLQHAALAKEEATRLQALFDSRSDAETTLAYPDMRLLVAREFATLHNGHIELENAPQDHYTFRVRLPIYQPDTLA